MEKVSRMWGPCLQGEDIPLGVMKGLVIRESRTLRAKLCGAYLVLLEIKGKKYQGGQEELGKDSPEAVGLQLCWEVGSFG